ncbi:MAG: hypothetical protein CSYNP_02820 [Syntrophus sp. SKADARSKE-3]|nr:hypothetical protein [Syntrophus sp. SKADARSKE-3]
MARKVDPEKKAAEVAHCEQMRRQVRMLLVQNDLDVRGYLQHYASKINENRSSLAMSLTGKRQFPADIERLQKLQKVIEKEIAAGIKK